MHSTLSVCDRKYERLFSHVIDLFDSATQVDLSSIEASCSSVYSSQSPVRGVYRPTVDK